MGAYGKAAIRDAKFDHAIGMSDLRAKIQMNEETYVEWRDLQNNAMEDDEVDLARSIGTSMAVLRMQTEEMWKQLHSMRR